MKTVCISSLTEQLNTTPSAIALGNFDGLHLGHQALLHEVLRSELHPAVFTFEDRAGEILTPLPEKARLMEAIGIETLFVAPFSLFSPLSPEAFVTWLKDTLACRLAVCGYNFHFGHQAAGDADTLKKLTNALGMSATIVAPVMQKGIAVSSSRLRLDLKQGDLEAASVRLGRPYSLSGTVAHGHGIGKTLSFPTINLDTFGNTLLPHGVYFTKAEIEGTSYPAITNIGNNPTFDRDKVSCETHLLAIEGDFYGKEVRLFFYHFHRAERRFSSPAELIKTVLCDIEAAKAFHGVTL